MRQRHPHTMHRGHMHRGHMHPRHILEPNHMHRRLPQTHNMTTEEDEGKTDAHDTRGRPMGIRLIIAAYFALLAMVLMTGVVALSEHYIQEPHGLTLDNP